jgi:hypothetical protein
MPFGRVLGFLEGILLHYRHTANFSIKALHKEKEGLRRLDMFSWYKQNEIILQIKISRLLFIQCSTYFNTISTFKNRLKKRKKKKKGKIQTT